MKQMNVGVLGTGAVGGYYGAMLARAGMPVRFVARPAQAVLLREKGLRLQAQSFDERLVVDAGDDPSALAGCDLVLCCVKSGDTEEAADQLAKVLCEGAVVLSLQNGVDNAARLAARLPAGVAAVPAVVYVAAEMSAPDHGRHHGRGELVLARWAPTAAVRRTWRGAACGDPEEDVRRRPAGQLTRTDAAAGDHPQEA